MPIRSHLSWWGVLIVGVALLGALLLWSPASGSGAPAAAASDQAIMRELRAVKRELRAVKRDVKAARRDAFKVRLAVTSELSDQSLYSLAGSIESQVDSIKRFGHP